MWIKINSLDIKAGLDPNYLPNYYKAGSSIRSTELVNPQLQNGRYFAVEVAYEYPDRIETAGGIGTLTGSYEYHDNFSFAVIYDDAVVQRVPADIVTPGGTQIYTSIVNTCDLYKVSKLEQYDNCAKKWAGYPAELNAANNLTQTNYISTSQLLDSLEVVSDITTSYYYYYYLPVNGPGMVPYGKTIARGASRWTVTGNAPINLGHIGLTKLQGGVLTQDGADPEPDYIVGLMYFQVVGAAGDGTFMALQQTSYSNTTMKHTGGAIKTASYVHCFDRGAGGIYSPGLCPVLNQGTPVHGGGEKSNGNLPGGYGIVYSNGLGGYQTRDNHVCVVP
jgi:hypothetical protein